MNPFFVVTGHALSHESPGLLAVSVIWFRYHNHVAADLYTKHSKWSDEQLYQASRRKVIAVLQVRFENE